MPGLLRGVARTAQAGSSASKWPYSFKVDPQPAALIMIPAHGSRSKAAIFLRADSRAIARLPLWAYSAPQHPCGCGTTTS